MSDEEFEECVSGGDLRFTATALIREARRARESESALREEVASLKARVEINKWTLADEIGSARAEQREADAVLVEGLLFLDTAERYDAAAAIRRAG
jgi:hypothetical protein